jgi:hypothetical protein
MARQSRRRSRSHSLTILRSPCPDPPPPAKPCRAPSYQRLSPEDSVHVIGTVGTDCGKLFQPLKVRCRGTVRTDCKADAGNEDAIGKSLQYREKSLKGSARACALSPPPRKSSTSKRPHAFAKTGQQGDHLRRSRRSAAPEPRAPVPQGPGHVAFADRMPPRL